MRNQLSGICVRCEDPVEPGEGYYDRVKIAGKWSYCTQHKSCAKRWHNVFPTPTVAAAKWAREMDTQTKKERNDGIR